MEDVLAVKQASPREVLESRPIYTPTESSETVQASVLLAIQQFVQANGPESGSDAEEALLHHVGRALQAQGGMVVVRRGLGARDMAKSASTLKNTFLVVRPAPDAEDLVVELSFREHFVVASSNAVYRQQLARLPSVFVGGRSALLKVVSVMAVAAAEMYLETRAEPPPWRSRSALLSKWLPARAFDSPVLGISSWRSAASTVTGTMDSCNVSDSYDSSSNSAASSYASLGSSVMSSGYQAELEMHTGAREQRAPSGAQLKQQGPVSASQVIYNAAAPVLRIVQPRVVYGFAI
ncbi:MAG: hypothetical protein WDW38_002724 [Sanguina aurantia]